MTWPGTSKTFKPIDKVSDIPLALKMLTYFDREDLHSFTYCQSIMWMAVSKLLSVVCVAGVAQGKSLGKNCNFRILFSSLMSLDSSTRYSLNRLL